MIYLDTSILVAYYCPEALSVESERLVRARVRPSISDLTEVELLSAVSRKVRASELDLREAGRIVGQFFAHLEGDLYNRLPLERRHYKLARDWMAQLTIPLRSLDALHLAVAAVEGVPFATADQALARSGADLGLRIIPVGGRRRSRRDAP